MDGRAALVGGCQCGEVQYQSAKPAQGLTFCYCSVCRRLHGGPFAPWTNVAAQDLEWIKDDGLVELAISDVASRGFCRHCHSPVTMLYKAVPDEVGIAASSVDEYLSKCALPKVQRHIFVAEKPSWFDIADIGEQFEGLPDDMKSYAVR